MTTHWNPELVAKLEAERVQPRPPCCSTPAQIAELIRAVAETDRDGKPRKVKP